MTYCRAKRKADEELAKAEAAKKKAKEANETGSTEEILVEEAPSTESSPGDDDIALKKVRATLIESFLAHEVWPWKINQVIGSHAPCVRITRKIMKDDTKDHEAFVNQVAAEPRKCPSSWWEAR